MACEAIQVACSTDADCLSGWACRDNPEGACWADSNGNRGCTPADPPKLCAPPYDDLGRGAGKGTSTDENTGAPSASGSLANGGETAPSASGDGGCSVSRRGPSSGRDALALCLALAAALGLGRRARRTAP
jgi:hypothetical protein